MTIMGNQGIYSSSKVYKIMTDAFKHILHTHGYGVALVNLNIKSSFGYG
jgi:hypothetical protein